MKYRIVGADGKTYGPAELDQIRLWLAQGRVESRTPVYVDGASAWTYLGLLPELSAEFANTPAVIGPVKTAPGPLRATNGFATAGLICSLLAWTCCCCLPFNLLGMIFCIIALVQINSQPVPQEGRMFAIVGLVLSAANLLFGFVLFLLQMILNPAVLNWQAGQF